MTQPGQRRTAQPTAQPTIASGEQSSLLEGLFSRRSVSPKRLVDPGPEAIEVEKIIAAALTAADHCGLRPWRFICIAGQSRQRLGNLFVAAKLRREPDLSAGELDRERDRALKVPVTIAIVAKCIENHPKVPLAEQHASVGAAIQNMLLCVHALGYGARMVSGRKTRDRILTRAMGLSTDEQLFGFICIGTPATRVPARKRAQVSEHLTIWTEDTGPNGA